MSRTYELSFKLGAQMAGSFAKTMTSASGTLANLNKNIASINSSQNSIQALQNLRKKSGELSRQLSSARENTARLSAEMRSSQAQTNQLGKQFRSATSKANYLGRQLNQTEEPTEELKQKFAQAQAEAKRLGTEFKKSQSETNKLESEFTKAQKTASTLKTKHSENRTELERLKQSMGSTGTSTKQLIDRQKQLAEAAEKAKKAQASLQSTISAQQANVAKRGELRGQLFDAVALAGSLAAPIKIAASFEQEMSKVGAVSRASSEDLAKLTKTARDLGASTNWSASQAAEGMQYLSMAGFNTQQTMAAMPGMLDLASAGAVDLGAAADIASNILSGFNLEADQMGALADVMANTFTTSNTNLTGLGETMKYVAPVASNLGVQVEQAAAMAGLLGDQGIQGSMAGTSLRSVLSRLAAPTGKAAKALEDLGIQTQDANGNMRDVPTILAEMDYAMKDMGSAARQEMISTVFGVEAATAASILLGKAGSGALDEYAESLTESGAAARIAAQQNANAMGALRRLSSAAESIAITLGNVLLPAVASGAEMLASMAGIVDSVAQRFPFLTKLVVGGVAALIALKIAAIAGGYAFTFLYGGVLQIVKIVKMARVAWLLYTTSMLAGTAATKTATIASKAMTAAQWLFNSAMLASPITWMVAAIVGLIAVGVALYKNWDTVSKYAQKAWGAIRNFGITALNGLKAAIINFTPVGWFMQAFGLAEGWLSNFSLFKSGQKILQTLGAGIRSAASSVVNSVKSVFSKVRQYLPFSDAKIGPFSELTKSGAAIMSTLADGVDSSGDLERSINGQLGQSSGGISAIGSASRPVSGGGDTFQFTIHQNITVGSDSAEVAQQAKQGASQGAGDLVKEFERAMQRERRLSYA